MPRTRKAAPALALAALAAFGLSARPAQAQTSVPYSFSVTNSNLTPQIFTFVYAIPVGALPAGSLVTDTVTGTLSADTSVPSVIGGDPHPLTASSVTITPSGQTFVTEVLVNGADGGIGAGDAQTSGAGTFTYGPPGGFVSSGVYGSPITSLGVRVQFLLSGQSSVSLNGTVTAGAATAPEPSSVAAFAFTGLGAAGLMLRARRRND